MKKTSCCCGSITNESMQNAKFKMVSGAKIKVLGSGCSKCKALESSVKAALDKLGLNEEIEHVTDFSEIAAYGVMTTPALVVDGKVVSYGKVLNENEVIDIIKKVRE